MARNASLGLVIAWFSLQAWAGPSDVAWHDLPVAVRELRTEAAAGYAPAQVLLGYLHANGYAGLPKDDIEAVRLYRLAAAQDDATGQINLGFMYAAGRG